MNNKFTKAIIVSTALELMRYQHDLNSLNLREIARKLGCTHTNLYNYFSSYNDLLWEAHAAIQEHFIYTLVQKLTPASSAELKLSCFFESFINMYLDNTGWFRLAWMEYIGGKRPQRDIIATETANQTLNKHITLIWQELAGDKPSTELIKRNLHNTHCYIIGEISNHLLGRGLIDNKDKLKTYLSNEAIRIFRLCMTGA